MEGITLLPNLADFYTLYREVRDHPRFKRVSHHWKELAMLSGVIISVMSAVAAFFSGSTYLAFSFFIVGGLSAIGAFYMRQFAALNSLEDTATTLSMERERLSLVSTVLEEENLTLVQTNQNLIRTNARLEQTEGRLRKQTALLRRHGERLNHSNVLLRDSCQQLAGSNRTLKKEIALLAVHTKQLEASSQHLQEELGNFSQGNKELEDSLQTLSENTEISKKLFNEVLRHLNAHEAALEQNIKKLCTYFSSISKINHLVQRLEEAQVINQQVTKAAEHLKELEARSLEKQTALASMQEAFEALLRGMQSANQDHAQYNTDLQQNITRLQGLIKD